MVLTAASRTAFGLINLLEPTPDVYLAKKEEYDVQQAMSQSMTENQGANQENGVVTGSAPHFGPANREHYDTQKWTMTHPRAYAQEILGNPEPPDRKREIGSPVFFKPSLANHRLPALIKILHSVPMGREALLCQGHLLTHYGYEEDWWDGVPVETRMTSDKRPNERTSPDSDEIIHETQRLVAFLEETERAYGSVDALAQLSVFKDVRQERMAGHYLEAWPAANHAVHADHPLASIFEVSSITTDHRDQEVGHHQHQIFEIEVPKGGSEAARTLYDLMDGQFWGDILESSSEYHYLHDVGEIFCIQISTQQDTAAGTGIKVPSNLDLDRYFPSSKSRIQEFLNAKRAVREGIAAIDDARDRLLKYKPSSSDQTMDAPSLLAKTLEQFQHEADGGRTFGDKTILNDLNTLVGNVSSKLIGRPVFR